MPFADERLNGTRRRERHLVRIRRPSSARDDELDQWMAILVGSRRWQR